MLYLLVPLSMAVLLVSNAAALTLLDDRRFLRAEEFTGTEGDCGTLMPAAAFETWSAQHGCIHGGGSQDSIATASELGGTDGIATFGGGFDVDVESRYEIDFEVEAPTLVRIEFDLAMETDGWQALSPETRVGFHLLLDGIAVYEYEASFEEYEPSFEDDFGYHVASDPTSGRIVLPLDPGGTYTFGTWLRSYRMSGTQADFSYSLTEVPEPATGLLVALGTAALAVARRSGSRSRAA